MPERVHLQVRLPKALRDKLAELAAKNDRSLNAEIIWQLEYGLVERVKPIAPVQFVVDPNYRLTELKRELGDDLIEKIAQLVEERMRK
jgi:Arc-like DNA binding dprotein